MSSITNKILSKLGWYDIYFYAQKSTPTPTKGTSKKKVILLMQPEYGNLGDQAIAYATELFFQNTFPEREILKFSEEDTLRQLKNILANARNDDIFVLQGGGNMGDLYPNIERLRRYCIKHITKGYLISMPTTAYFTESKFGKIEQKRSVEAYNNNRNILFLAREEFTFRWMNSHVTSNSSELVPDIVFYLNGKIRILQEDRNTPLIVLRRDAESNFTEDEQNKLIEHINRLYPDLFLFDTMVTRKISKESRQIEVGSIIREFFRAKFVITDRMHAMVFCALTNTPCVVMKSHDNKIIGMYEWIKEVKNIKLIEKSQIGNIEQFVNQVTLPENQNNHLDLSTHFDVLKDEFRKRYE